MVPASGSLVVLGGRDGSAQPMATGDIEQFDVEHDNGEILSVCGQPCQV